MASFPTLRLYDQGPNVRILQMNLFGLNYIYNGLQVTGTFDELTYEVVQDFQAENKLISDGIVGPVTWKMLIGKVATIQGKLNSVNFNSGVPDGIYGAKTSDAVKRFQAVSGLKINGIFGPRTRQQLFNPNSIPDYSKMPSSKSLTALNSYVAILAQNFINLCRQNNIIVSIIVSFRSWYEQDILYQKGRTTTGSVVTDAQGGDSYHNWGLAFDAAPVQNGVINWNDIATFNSMGQLGEQVGLEWGGNWTTYKIALVDLPHYQYTYGLSTEDLLNGKRPPR